MEQGIRAYVGLDVHKDSIAIAVAEAGRSAGRMVGQIAHDVPKLLKALARLGEPGELYVVYEAGPTGYGLQRALFAKGYRCEVIAPSLIPRRAGDRVKTDRRDCLRLAELSGNPILQRYLAAWPYLSRLDLLQDRGRRPAPALAFDDPTMVLDRGPR